MDRLKTLVIRFDNPISIQEIPLFRGAIINILDDASMLFHNHEEEGFRYSYPLIQYKRINKCAAIVCVGEGTEAIGEFFATGNFNVRIGDRKETLKIASIKANQAVVQIWNDMFPYHLRRWLPLNQENYSLYAQMESLADKYAMLEKILTGNILSFAKGVGIHFENQVLCKMTDIGRPNIYIYKNVKMTGFDVAFKTNVSIPDYIGLGKGVSLGFGTVVRKRLKQEEKI